MTIYAELNIKMKETRITIRKRTKKGRNRLFCGPGQESVKFEF